jgi:ubiquinone biosynthesis protein Coq4
MIRLELLAEAARCLRDPATVSDGALLKSLALSDRGFARARRRLAGFVQGVPLLDLASLRSLPEGSFGRALAQFCDDHRIALLRPSERLRRLSAENPVAVRYAATHDLVHVLLDEAPDPAGEVAVYAWSCAQGYLVVHWFALVAGWLVWSARRPWQSLRLARAARRGYRKGSTMPMLLSERLEDRMMEPLVDVRRQLGVA